MCLVKVDQEVSCNFVDIEVIHIMHKSYPQEKSKPCCKVGVASHCFYNFIVVVVCLMSQCIM